MNATKAATPAKLKSGAWGARVEGAVNRGDTVTITTRAGKSWDARVTQVVWTGNGVSIVATEGIDRPAASGRASYAGRSARRYCYCQRPLDEGDGECMQCGYEIR